MLISHYASLTAVFFQKELETSAFSIGKTNENQKFQCQQRAT